MGRNYWAQDISSISRIGPSPSRNRGVALGICSPWAKARSVEREAGRGRRWDLDVVVNERLYRASCCCSLLKNKEQKQ